MQNPNAIIMCIQGSAVIEAYGYSGPECYEPTNILMLTPRVYPQINNCASPSIFTEIDLFFIILSSTQESLFELCNSFEMLGTYSIYTVR